MRVQMTVITFWITYLDRFFSSRTNVLSIYIYLIYSPIMCVQLWNFHNFSSFVSIALLILALTWIIKWCHFIVITRLQKKAFQLPSKSRKFLSYESMLKSNESTCMQSMFEKFRNTFLYDGYDTLCINVHLIPFVLQLHGNERAVIYV